MMSVHDWWGSGIHCLTEGWKYIPTHIKLILWWATILHKKSWEMGFTQIQFLSGNFLWSPWISTMLWEGDLAEVYISFKNIILWLIFILVFVWTGLVQIPTLQQQLHFRKWFISCEVFYSTLGLYERYHSAPISSFKSFNLLFSSYVNCGLRWLLKISITLVLDIYWNRNIHQIS